MRMLKRSLALALIFSLLTGIVPFDGQMETGQFGLVATVQAKAKKKIISIKALL